MNRAELADKVEWEGGVPEAILGRGISPDELPDDVPPEVSYAWHELYGNGRWHVQVIEDWLYPDD